MDWLLDSSTRAVPLRARMLLGALAAAAVLLCLPATALAGERAEGSRLASAGLLAYGAGYGSEGGSKPVRELQRRLRSLGDRPGPIDGLYGPLTTAAVTRFQRAHGVAVDGMVGPQTRTRLLAQRPAEASASKGSEVERKSPAPGDRAESASDPQPARDASGPQPARDAGRLKGVELDSSSGLAPVFAALLAAAAVALLLGAGWVLGRRSRGRPARRTRSAKPAETRLSFGMVCAALLAMFAIGAVGGAVFATQAAPEDGAEVRAYRSALVPDRAPTTRVPPRVAQRAPAKRARSKPDATARPDPVAIPTEEAPVASPSGAGLDTAAPAPAPAPQGTAGGERSDRPRATYTVRRRPVPWPMAGLTLGDQPTPGDSDPTVAGEELKVP